MGSFKIRFLDSLEEDLNKFKMAIKIFALVLAAILIAESYSFPWIDHDRRSIEEVSDLLEENRVRRGFFDKISNFMKEENKLAALKGAVNDLSDKVSDFAEKVSPVIEDLKEKAKPVLAELSEKAGNLALAASKKLGEADEK